MSGLLAEDEVLDIIRAAYLNEKIRLVEYSVGRSAAEKSGYLGEHFNLSVTVQEDEPSDNSFFIKTYTVEPNKLDFIGETGMFQKEVSLYRDVIGKFRVYVRGPEWCPRYYFSKHRVLVLEDLSLSDFRMKSDAWALDKDHVELVLRAVASLHASGIVLEETEGESLDRLYPACFREILYDEDNLDSPTYMWKSRQVLDLVEAVDFIDKYSDAEKLAIKKYLPRAFDMIYPLSKKSERWRNVMLHGDMWNNNLLFRYERGKPVDCRLVDFQFSRYAPAMHDVMHLLYFTTDKSLRDESEGELLRAYHDFLRDVLRENGLDVNDSYPWSEFLESKRPYKLLALIQSTMSMNYLLGGREAQDDPKFRAWDGDKVEARISDARRESLRRRFRDDDYVRIVVGNLCELIDDYILDDEQRRSLGISPASPTNEENGAKK